jgi:hypothetical protein
MWHRQFEPFNTSLYRVIYFSCTVHAELAIQKIKKEINGKLATGWERL